MSGEVSGYKMKLEKLKELIKKYESNRDTYLKNTYNETQLRTDFLDPLFNLLGWDIVNNQGKPTNEREVLVEESLKTGASLNTKKPDYTFRLFSQRKFFLEAKKPSVKIDSDNDPAKQIRRYGFTAKLKISVLSNFEYLAIYDCSRKVDETDDVNYSRIKLYHYSEYLDYFEDINKELGKDSVYDGTFDEHWSDIEDQIRLSSVDDLFLTQINDWRLILGNTIYQHNRDLDSITLNDIVQSYINSIIFLRVCEDRNIEQYKTLLNFADNKDFSALLEKFVDADTKFNAGLFNQPYNQEIINNSHSAFWEVIHQLYYPESTFSFSVFASDILGNIYEIFLAERLEITEEGITLTKKPEHLDRDIVTTPTHIIQDILRQTVLEFCRDKTDQEILNSSFADIACGSGAFLLETYQLLHDTLVDYYLKNNPENIIPNGVNSYKLKFEIKTSILVNCIYGVDKDFNAVEACKFGLLLKLLEGETNDSIPSPALPNIDASINYGNSLIDFKVITNQDVESINPFDFEDKKFDVIVGNPPYMATEHMRQLIPLEYPIYSKEYYSAFKQYDKYFLFIERGLNLLTENGYLGYIVPSKLTKVGAAKRLREMLVEKGALSKIFSFGANQIFKNKTTYTCLLILRGSSQTNLEYTEVDSLKDWEVRNSDSSIPDSVSLDELDKERWVLVPGHLKDIYLEILSKSSHLENIVGSDNIYNGIQTSANSIYIHRALNEDEDFIYFLKDGVEWKIERALTKPYFKTVGLSSSLNTYRPFEPNSFVIYPYYKSADSIEFIDIETLQEFYPYAYEYLNSYKHVLSNPRRDVKPIPQTENEWYRYGRHQSLDKCDVPAKIIVGVLSQGDKYAIDYHGTLISSGGTAGYCMITLPDDSKYSIYYIQAILNSKYSEWFSGLYGEVFRGGYIARGTKVLKKLPIRIINFEKENERLMHDQIADLQRRLITLQGQIDQNAGNRRALAPFVGHFRNHKTRLDSLLRELYGLGERDNLVPLISEIYAAN